MKIIARYFNKTNKEDFNNVINVWVNAFQKQGKEEDLVRRLKDEIARGDYFLVAEDIHPIKIIGWISGRRWHDWTHGSFELVHIGVLPEYQGTDAASLLFKEFERHALNRYVPWGGLRQIWLVTSKENIRAQKFYEKMGMKKITKWPDCFHEGDTQFLFVKKYSSN